MWRKKPRCKVPVTEDQKVEAEDGEIEENWPDYEADCSRQEVLLYLSLLGHMTVT